MRLTDTTTSQLKELAETESHVRNQGDCTRRCKRDRSMITHKNTCSIIQMESLEVSQEQLEPLIDFLAELLVEERLGELEQSSEHSLKGATKCS